MLISMDIMNINNVSDSLSHFDSTHSLDDDDVVTPSNVINGTTRSSKLDNQLMRSSVGRKRKTRRFKSRYKGKKLSKKSQFDVLKQVKRRVYPQSEAPYNTNQFLMAEHTIENLDDNLVCVKKGERQRDPSFTSVDSDEDQFYSSPEDEDEFLSKDFADTYQSVCAEKFGDLSKAQLTKIIFELESKVEDLQKKINTSSNMDEMSVMLKQMNGFENNEAINTSRIDDVISENERLRRENEALKKFIKDNAVTTSSSSSSSSDESGSTNSEPEMKNVDNSTERMC